jgi:transposase-like protein
MGTPAVIEVERSTDRAAGLSVVQESYVQGISTRSVDDLVQAWGMSGISKNQVSRLCGEIDDKVKTCLGRPNGATGRMCGSTPPT